MRLWAYQAVSRGADMISFFRWRTCRHGREQYWHGILYHHGEPQRRYKEVAQLGAEFAALSPELDGSEVRTPIALLYDYDSLWALETQPNVEQDFSYIAMAARYHNALSRLGINVDAVGVDAIGPESDWSGYRAILAPSVHVLTPALTERLKAFVRDGGTLLLGPRSGVKDAENAIVNELLPGLLREMAGCYVEEYDAFSDVVGLEMTVQAADGSSYGALALADVLVPEGEAQTLLSYGARYYAGRPAAVENAFGQGRCLYLGTVPDDEGLRALLRAWVLDPLGLPAVDDLPDSVEVSRRSRGDQTYAFYLNHGEDPVQVQMPTSGVDLLTGQEVRRSVVLDGYGVLIVKE
jgi:beta-galactosidase